MKNLFKLFLTSAMLVSLFSCEMLYDAKSDVIEGKEKAAQDAEDAKVANLDSLSVVTLFDDNGSFLGTGNERKIAFTIDQEDATVELAIVNVLPRWTNRTTIFNNVALELEIDNGGTSNATATVNLAARTAASPYELTITSKDGSVTKVYDVYLNEVTVPDNLGIIGTSAGGWDNDEFDLVATSASTYTAVTHLAVGEFKFRVDDAWTENYGRSGSATDNSYTLAAGGDNIAIATAGFYLLRVDFAAGTILVLPVTNFGIIGAATPGSWDAQTAMTGNTTTDVFSITTTTTAGEMKFRINDNWSYNFGAGNPAAWDGGNITVPAAGNTTITFNGRTLQYVVPVSP